MANLIKNNNNTNNNGAAPPRRPQAHRPTGAVGSTNAPHATTAPRPNILAWFDIEKYLTKTFVLHNLPFLFFLMLLLIIYIYSNRQIESKARQINKLNTELKELRWEYISLKTQLTGNSKQSAVAQKVQPFGLEELTKAPQKIYVEE